MLGMRDFVSYFSAAMLVFVGGIMILGEKEYVAASIFFSTAILICVIVIVNMHNHRTQVRIAEALEKIAQKES